MKRSSFRTWRENRLIEDSMRNSPAPKPPEGLKDRLIHQAQAAATPVPHQSARRGLRLLWIAPSVALVVLACWVAFHSPVPEPASRPTPRRTVTESVAVPKTTKKQPLAFVRQPKVALRTWHPRLRHRRSQPQSQPVLAVEHHPTQSPLIRVSITRRSESAVGYARVAAYSTDESGRKVRTAWTLIDDPKARTSSQEMSGVDASGRRQLLKVAVVMPSDQPKGEEL